MDAKCRCCDNFTKTVDHLIAGCQVLASNEYKYRHDRLGQYLHWEIRKHYQLSAPNNWFEHHPQAVTEGDNVTILWHFPIHTDRSIQANRPEIIVKDSIEKNCLLIDMSVPTDQNIAAKEFDNMSKYKDLEIEISRMWKSKAIALPVITGTLGMIKKGCQSHLDKIPGQTQLQEIQKIVLKSTAHILRKTLSV